MHVKVTNIILGVSFFVLMSISEVVHYFAKKDMELSDLLKKIRTLRFSWCVYHPIYNALVIEPCWLFFI